MTAPCWHCPNMRLGCHGTCDAYKAYDAQQQALRRKRQEYREGREVFWAGVRQSVEQEWRTKTRRKPRKRR